MFEFMYLLPTSSRQIIHTNIFYVRACRRQIRFVTWRERHKYFKSKFVLSPKRCQKRIQKRKMHRQPSCVPNGFSAHCNTNAIATKVDPTDTSWAFNVYDYYLNPGPAHSIGGERAVPSRARASVLTSSFDRLTQRACASTSISARAWSPE